MSQQDEEVVTQAEEEDEEGEEGEEEEEVECQYVPVTLVSAKSSSKIIEVRTDCTTDSILHNAKAKNPVREHFVAWPLSTNGNTFAEQVDKTDLSRSKMHLLSMSVPQPRGSNKRKRDGSNAERNVRPRTTIVTQRQQMEADVQPQVVPDNASENVQLAEERTSAIGSNNGESIPENTTCGSLVDQIRAAIRQQKSSGSIQFSAVGTNATNYVGNELNFFFENTDTLGASTKRSTTSLGQSFTNYLIQKSGNKDSEVIKYQFQSLLDSTTDNMLADVLRSAYNEYTNVTRYNHLKCIMESMQAGFDGLNTKLDTVLGGQIVLPNPLTCSPTLKHKNSFVVEDLCSSPSSELDEDMILPESLESCGSDSATDVDIIEEQVEEA